MEGQGGPSLHSTVSVYLSPLRAKKELNRTGYVEVLLTTGYTATVIAQLLLQLLLLLLLLLLLVPSPWFSSSLGGMLKDKVFRGQ